VHGVVFRYFAADPVLLDSGDLDPRRAMEFHLPPNGLLLH